MNDEKFDPIGLTKQYTKQMYDNGYHVCVVAIDEKVDEDPIVEVYAHTVNFSFLLGQLQFAYLTKLRSDDLERNITTSIKY